MLEIKQLIAAKLNDQKQQKLKDYMDQFPEMYGYNGWADFIINLTEVNQLLTKEIQRLTQVNQELTANNQRLTEEKTVLNSNIPVGLYKLSEKASKECGREVTVSEVICAIHYASEEYWGRDLPFDRYIKKSKKANLLGTSQ